MTVLLMVFSFARAPHRSCPCRYRVIMAGNQPWQEEVVQQVSLRLFRACSDLSQAYKQFDLNNDGTIEYSVRGACSTCVYHVDVVFHLAIVSRRCRSL